MKDCHTCEACLEEWAPSEKRVLKSMYTAYTASTNPSKFLVTMVR